MTTRGEAILGAAADFVEARIERDARTPRQAAEAAWYPGHRLGSIEAIEAKFISLREEALAAYEAQQPRPLAA